MRLDCDVRLLLEVVKEPTGEALVQEPLDELDHLAAEARYQAVSQHGWPDEPGAMRAGLTPILDGEGTVETLRLKLEHARPGRQLELDFPKQIAGARGTELATQLIAAGALQQGDQYRVRLAAIPIVHTGRSGLNGDEDEDAHVDEQPFPVRPLSLARWNIERSALETADADRPVLIHRPVLEDTVAEAVRHGNQETGKLLLGHLVEDRHLLELGKNSAWAVVVTEQAAAPDGAGTPTSFTFPPESFRRARQLADLRADGESVVGSQHSHGWRCHECDKQCEIRNLFFSADDVRMAGQFPVYAVFLVAGGDPDQDKQKPVVRAYVRRQGLMKAVRYGVFD